ncbi:alpha/beta-hydrolase family protein [Prescottella equi]|nr:alpha/beta-hydrolase family protein [Prescottella equi]WJJ09788.1 alpha/beta-hydrolase family protein [Prescottella equi]
MHSVARSFHPAGLVGALLFFAWSMTPSLLPRPWYLQGVATGISMAIGYGIGCGIAWAVRRCGISPQWAAPTRRRGWWLLAATATVVVPTFLVVGSVWQQRIRELVGVEQAYRTLYLPALVVALVVGLALVGIGRALRSGVDGLARQIARVGWMTPVARVTALGLVVVLGVLFANGVLHRGLLTLAERSAHAADLSTAEGVVQPASAERSGSPHSNEAWDTLGREGRTFVAGGPTAEQIAQVTQAPAMTPIRAYAGRESADSVTGIAEHVVAELERTNAFDRKVLAVVTTTGRGWINPNVANAFEYINGGNTAIAAMQYSFLPSALSFIADRDTPQEAGRALFEQVHAAWAQRPENRRPKLVVFGESLGSYGGQSAFASGSDIVERTDGALFVGTPNFAQPWGRITDTRDSGSTERLPVVDDGRHVRFASRPEDTALPGNWEASRVVYWQHASDPITWWSFDLALRQPDWLRESPGPDVYPGMRWLPIVTFWQVTLDMIFSADVPAGAGHTYGPDAVYLWAQILQPQEVDSERVHRIYVAMAAPESKSLTNATALLDPTE